MKKVLTVATGLLLVVAAGCEQNPIDPKETPEAASATDRGVARGNSNVVEVTSTGQSFEAPDEVPAGWTTFRFSNESDAIHFVILEKMPVFEGEQMTVEDSRAEVVPVFQNIMDDINGDGPSFPDAGFALPAWYPDVTFVGGPGLTSPGETSETTVNLEPGTYVIECYVKTPGGTFHSTNGMVEGLTVTEETSRAREPRPTLTARISSTDGIEVEGASRPGRHTVAVRYEDQAVYSHFLGHDVHLVRLDDSTDMGALAAWMNWATPGGLATPAPADFLGGVQDMPAGSTAYFEVLLKPGSYAWIAEVPDPDAENMLQTFTVP